MSALALLPALGLPLALGALVLRVLGITPRTDRLAFLGWAWCLGALATGGVVFALAWVPGALAGPLAPAVGVAVLGAALWFGSRRVERTAQLAVVPGSAPERVLFTLVVAGVVALVLLRVLAASTEPVLTDDEGNFWALKAKMIFLAGGFDRAFAAAAHEPNYLYNADYPNLNPLLQVWVFGWMGRIVHVANRLPMQLFALAQVFLAAAALRRVARPAVAAAALVVLVAPAEAGYQAGLAHGDLLVGTGVLVALDAWWRWRASGAPAFFRLACCGLGLVLWSKNDGLVWVICFWLALGVAWLVGRLARHGALEGRPVAATRWWWLAVPVVVLVAHRGFNAHFGFASGFMKNELRDEGLLGLLVRQFPERGGVVARYFLDHIVLSVEHSGAVFGALVVVLVVGLLSGAGGWSRTPEVLAPGLAVVGGLVALVLIFVGAPHDVQWHLQTAAGRVAFQLQPVAVLWLARVSAGVGRQRYGSS